MPSKTAPEWSSWCDMPYVMPDLRYVPSNLRPHVEAYQPRPWFAAAVNIPDADRHLSLEILSAVAEMLHGADPISATHIDNARFHAMRLMCAMALETSAYPKDLVHIVFNAGTHSRAEQNMSVARIREVADAWVLKTTGKVLVHEH